jgi:hypothetical protein
VSCFRRLMWSVLLIFDELAKTYTLLTARSCDTSKSKANAFWNVLYYHLFDRRNAVGSKSLLDALPRLRNEMCRKNNARFKTCCVRVFA